ncbi:MAG TPA: inositol monophosphatase family protein [Trueperaceae bacterium]
MLPADLWEPKEAAVRLAAELGRWARERSDEHFAGGGSLGVSSKSSPGDFVTSVDLAVQERLVAALTAAFPGFGLLGEEAGLSRVETDEPVWVIDPIDGTHNFLRNYPGFCVSIGLVHRGRPVLGAIYESSSDAVSWAVAGGGAWREPAEAVLARAQGAARRSTSFSGPPSGESAERLRVSTHRRLELALLTSGFTNAAANDAATMAVFGDLLRSAAGCRLSGSACRDLSLVASGRVDVFFQHGISPWDVAAGAVIVEEAGGRVHLELSGPDLTRSGPLNVFAGAPGVLEEVLDRRRAVLEAFGASAAVPGPSPR